MHFIWQHLKNNSLYLFRWWLITKFNELIFIYHHKIFIQTHMKKVINIKTE